MPKTPAGKKDDGGTKWREIHVTISPTLRKEWPDYERIMREGCIQLVRLVKP